MKKFALFAAIASVSSISFCCGDIDSTESLDISENEFLEDTIVDSTIETDKFKLGSEGHTKSAISESDVKNVEITKVRSGKSADKPSTAAGRKLKLALDPKNESGLPPDYYDDLARIRQENKRLDVSRRQGSAETYAPSSLFRKNSSSVDLETDLGDYGSSKFDDPYIVNPSPERIKETRANNRPFHKND